MRTSFLLEERTWPARGRLSWGPARLQQKRMAQVVTSWALPGWSPQGPGEPGPLTKAVCFAHQFCTGDKDVAPRPKVSNDQEAETEGVLVFCRKVYGSGQFYGRGPPVHFIFAADARARPYTVIRVCAGIHESWNRVRAR